MNINCMKKHANDKLFQANERQKLKKKRKKEKINIIYIKKI